MILMSNLTKKKASSLKVIDYILAAPAAIAVEAFITGGFHSRNKFYELGKTEFAIVAGIATWMKTAETVALYREFIISCIEEVKNG